MKRKMKNSKTIIIAIIGIILENRNNVEVLNRTLSDFGGYIIGRMGVPYKEKNVNIISVAIDAPIDVINELNDKIGKIEGISVNTVCSNE